MTHVICFLRYKLCSQHYLSGPVLYVFYLHFKGFISYSLPELLVLFSCASLMILKYTFLRR